MPVHVLFGRTRRARQLGVAALLRDPRDEVGRPAVLRLVGTWRQRRQLLREEERRGGFPPDVVVFEEWFAVTWRRFGDGRALFGPRAAALAARRWGESRGLSLDAGAAAELARAERASAVTGRLPADPEVARRLLELRAWLDAHPTHVREAHALAWLRSRLGPELAGRHRAVALEELDGLSPLAAELCVAACRAWSEADASVVLALPAGRDRGGAEVGQALGFEEADDREARVFEPTRALRAAAFEGLVATGEASVLRCGEGGLLEVEPGLPLPVGEADLADDLAGGRPPERPSFGPIRLGPDADPRAEVERVARALRRALAEGVDPRDCLVAVSSPLYDRLVEDVFADHDLPWERAGGRAAGHHPTALAVRRALRSRSAGLPTADLLALLAATGEPRARTLAAWCRSAGVRRGPPESWVGRLRSWAVRAGVDPGEAEALVEPARALVERLPPDGPGAGREVEDRVRAALALLADPDPAVHAAILRASAELSRDLAAVGGTWSSEVLAEELDRALSRLTVIEPGEPEARIPVIGIRERSGLTPRHGWVLGLARGLFPAAGGSSRLLGPEDPSRPDPGAEGRALLASLLRDALGDPAVETLDLSWPAAVEGRATLPSPLLAEWLEAPTGQGPLGPLWPRPTAPELPGRREGVRRAALDPALREQLAPADRLGIERAASWRAALEGPPGPRDGVLRRPPPAPRELPVTTLETWLRCPQRYWYRHVLRLAEPDPWDPELEPRRRGTALHRILEEFLRSRDLRPLSGEPDPGPTAAALHAVASRVLDEVEAEGGFDPVYQRYARDRWLAGLIDDRPRGLLRAWLEAELRGPPRIPEAVERSFSGLALGPIALRGTLDRVDRLPGGARVVTDYKTGRAPTREEVELGLSLQPAAYLTATLAADPSLPVAACFLSLARPDDLRRTGWVGDPAALSLAAGPQERRGAASLDAEGLQGVLERAADAARDLIAGRFPPSPHPPERAGCPTCPYRTACRRDEERHAR